MGGGGQVSAPSRARQPEHTQVLGVQRSAEHSDGTRGAQSAAAHSCLAPGQAPQGMRFWLQPCPFQPGRAVGKGPTLPMLRSVTASLAQPSRGGGGSYAGCPTLCLPAACERGGRHSAPPRPGLGWDGPVEAASLVLLPRCSHRAQVCYSASTAACSLNSSR